MKKVVSVLVLSLSLQSATSLATTQSVESDVATLIKYAQSHNLSAEQTLLFAQQAIDQAAHGENARIKVQRSYQDDILVIIGAVVVVVVICGVAYYCLSEKKITTARGLAEELIKRSEEGFSSSEDQSEWIKDKSKDLSDREKIYFVKALQALREHVGRPANLNDIQKHLVKMVEGARKQPVTFLDHAMTKIVINFVL